MRILWVNTHAAFIGGCEQYMLRCADELNRHNVTSALLYENEKTADPQFLDGFSSCYTTKNIQEAMSQFEPDIIFIQKLGDPALKLLINIPIPKVKFFHDYETFCLKGIKLRPFTNEPCYQKAGCSCYPFFCQLVRTHSRFGITLRTLWHLRRSQNLHRQLQGFCVPSNYVGKEAVQSGFDRTKIRTFYPMIPKKKQRKSSVKKESKLVLYIGQLLRGKGVDVAIDAMTHLSPSYQLVIIGAGRKRSTYERQVKRLNLQDRITFTGFLSGEEIAKWRQRASCQVVPSRHPEPFGTVGIEAMQYGIPVVGSNLGGIPESLKDEKNGLLVPHNNPKALAEAVDKICSNPELAEAMAQEGKKTYLELSDPGKHVGSLLSFFQELIDRKKLTVNGSEKVENTLQQLLEEATEAVKAKLPRSKVKALLLTGGYGRGEGGVIRNKNEERPHNNLDFLLITNGSSKGLKDPFREALNPISKKYQIGFDLSVASNIKLRLSPTHLVWYEVFHGHHLLIGDPEYVNSLPFSNPKHILSRDLLELMINRGTLYIINDLLLQNNVEFNDERKRIFIKHMMKATIGFGDALLYSMGEYHWSYQEKLKRIVHHENIPAKLKQTYKEAAEFRFQPNYEKYFKRDFRKWLDEELDFASEIYIDFERIRLHSPFLKWDDYSEKFLQNALIERVNSFSGIARKLKGFYNSPRSVMGMSKRAQLGFRTLSPAERLSLFFPFIAFGKGKNLEKIGHFLGVRTDTQAEYDRAYLKYWSQHGDINFIRSVEEWGINLE